MKRLFYRQLAWILVLAAVMSLACSAEDSVPSDGPDEVGGMLSLKEDTQIIADNEEDSAKAEGPLELIPAEAMAAAETREPSEGGSGHETALAQNAVPGRLTLGVKETYPLKAEKCSFVGSDRSVATVSKKGVIRARKKGTARITVISGNVKVGICQVTVKAAPKKVSLGMKSVVLGLKETLTLTPVVPKGSHAGFTWTSKDKKIATVNRKGVVKARGVGSTRIVVKTHNGKKAVLKVTVRKAPAKVTLAPKRLNLGLGETGTLTAKLPKKSASFRLKWKSSDETVAKVDGTGTVTAVGAGTAKITVTTFNKKKAACTVTVAPVPEKVSLDWKSVVLGLKETLALTPVIPPMMC